MSVQATITLDMSTAAARRLLEDAGYTVVRVVRTPTKKDVTPVTAGVRASALLDIPAGLPDLEQRAYVAGYAKGCVAYVKKHGAPSVSGLPVDVVLLHKRTREHEWARHPSCHRAGLSALKKWQDREPAPTVQSVPVLRVADQLEETG